MVDGSTTRANTLIERLPDFSKEDADVGPVLKGEAIIEIPEDVLKFYQSNQ